MAHKAMWRSSVAAVVALLLSGCGPGGGDSGGGGPSPGPAPGPGYPQSLAEVQANHEEALFTKQDRTQILKDYTGISKVRVWTQFTPTGDEPAPAPVLEEFIGLERIGVFFDRVFQEVQRDFDQIESKLSSKTSAWLLCWRSIPGKYDRVTETLVLDDDTLKIITHNIVILKPAAPSTSASSEVETKVAYDPPGSIDAALTRHEDALPNVGSSCCTSLVVDYRTDVEVFYLDWNDADPKAEDFLEVGGVIDIYDKNSQIRPGKLQDFPSNPSDFKQRNVDATSAFLVWEGATKTVTNTFVYDTKNIGTDTQYKIVFQTLAVALKPAGAAKVIV